MLTDSHLADLQKKEDCKKKRKKQLSPSLNMLYSITKTCYKKQYVQSSLFFDLMEEHVSSYVSGAVGTSSSGGETIDFAYWLQASP